MLKDCISFRGEFTCIEGQFVFSRQIGFYFFCYYIPTTLIVVIRTVFNFVWARFLVEAFDENFSKLDSLLDIIKLIYEQTTMIRLSFGMVTLVVIAIQLGFKKCSMFTFWFAIRIENLIVLQQIGPNRFETDQVCLLVNNFKNEYYSDQYLGKSREWVFDRDQWTAWNCVLIF